MQIVQHNYEIISAITERLLQQQCNSSYEIQHTYTLHGEDPSCTQVHLQINKYYVATDYQLVVRHVSTKPALDNYYIKKYGWSQPTITLINWKAHGKALHLLTGQKLKTTTTQLINQWLPLNGESSQNHTSTAKLCPFCNSVDKKRSQYLICSHTKCTSNRTQAIVQIHAKISKYHRQIHHQLRRLIKVALTNWLTNPQPIIPTFLHQAFHALLSKQSMIGWDQIINGYFAHAWTNFNQQDIYPTKQWVSFLIKTILIEFYGVCKLRCAKIRDSAEDQK
jgi:hypothetical protein